MWKAFHDRAPSPIPLPPFSLHRLLLFCSPSPHSSLAAIPWTHQVVSWLRAFALAAPLPIQLTLEQHRGWGANPPRSGKSMRNLHSALHIHGSSVSAVLHPWIQPITDHVELQYLLLKKSACKGTPAVQTPVVWGSTLILLPHIHMVHTLSLCSNHLCREVSSDPSIWNLNNLPHLK